MELNEIIEQEKERIKDEEKALAVKPEVFNAPTTDVKKGTDDMGDLVESAFKAAVIHRVQTDENVQNELLESADTVIQNKVGAIKDKADEEAKAAHFNNKKGACECFGYNESTTERWAVDVMNLWHNVMTGIWLVLGFFTFAPITFIAKKITVIFKKAWVAVLLAVVIYLAVILIPLLSSLLIK